MRKILLIICCSLFFKCLAQEREITIRDRSSLYSTDKITSIRIGGLLQKGYYGELGISKEEIGCGCLGCSSQGYYSSVEWTPSKQNDIYGLKVGYEWNITIFNLGIEAKYLSNFSNEKDFMITPKIGLGYVGIINIFYGYNISTNRYPFSEIGGHQLSIVFNVPFLVEEDY